MLSLVEFAKRTGENYKTILFLCKEGQIKCAETEGGHYKIYETEVEKFLGKNNEEFITKEQYEKVIRENERLKMVIEQMKNIVTTWS